MSDEQLLREYLESEIEENVKGARYGTIMFVILCLVVFGYFRWLRGALEEVVQPTTLARTVVTEVDRQIPVFTQSMTDGIRDELPKIAKFAIDTVIDNSIPAMRKNAVGFLEEHARSLSEFASFTGHEIFVRVLREKRDEIRKQNPVEGAPMTADQIVTALNANMKLTLSKQLTISMAEEVDSNANEDSVAIKLHKSAQSLRNINAKLNELADSEGGSRNDVMSKRIIGAWWSWLRTSHLANQQERDEEPEISDDNQKDGFGPPKDEPEDEADEINVLPEP